MLGVPMQHGDTSKGQKKDVSCKNHAYQEKRVGMGIVRKSGEGRKGREEDIR